MDLPGVSIADSGDSSMFSLSTINKHKVKRQPSLSQSNSHPLEKVEVKKKINVVHVFHYQSLADISKGDMKAADDLGDEDDDLHLSEDEDDEADKMSLASDLDDEDMEEVVQKQEELEKKAKKNKK